MKKGFSLTELMVALTAVVVIAIIVIPFAVMSMNDRAYQSKRKTFVARISQAIIMLPKIEGYGTLTSSVDTASETFILEGLSKVIKMKNQCRNDNLSNCNLPATITALDGSSQITLESIKTLNGLNPLAVVSNPGGIYGRFEQLDIKAAAFRTANGESVLVYYNPYCSVDLKDESWSFSQPSMCVNFIYDLNGAKAPNEVGKDVGFISVIYSSESAVAAPMPIVSSLLENKTQAEAATACQELNSESRLPSIEELMSMFYNKNLINIQSGYLWSSSIATVGNTGTAWSQNFNYGIKTPYTKTSSIKARCVRK